MAKEANPRRQAGQKHPDAYQRDLNPNWMGGQNIGREAEAREQRQRTAFDVKPVHRMLRDITDDELKQIPILEAGVRLRQGATYLDLEAGEFTATGEMAVPPGHEVVPKDGVHYETWNKLVGDR